MSTKSNEKNDLYAHVNSTPEKESDMTDFQKELDVLLNEPECSVQEAVEVMTAMVKESRRKCAGRLPWAIAGYWGPQYLFWLGNGIFPKLWFYRKDCNRLRRTLKQALREAGAIGRLDCDLLISVDLCSGILDFIPLVCGARSQFRLNRRRCRELIAVLAPANLDLLKREHEERMQKLQKESPDGVGGHSLPCDEKKH